MTYRIIAISMTVALTATTTASAALSPQNRAFLLLCREEGTGNSWRMLSAHSRLPDCDAARVEHRRTGHQVQCSARDLSNPQEMRGVVS